MDKTQEALFELAVDAFLEGVADVLPHAEEFGLTPARQEQLVDRRIEAFLEKVA